MPPTCCAKRLWASWTRLGLAWPAGSASPGTQTLRPSLEASLIPGIDLWSKPQGCLLAMGRVGVFSQQAMPAKTVKRSACTRYILLYPTYDHRYYSVFHLKSIASSSGPPWGHCKLRATMRAVFNVQNAPSQAGVSTIYIQHNQCRCPCLLSSYQVLI